jgi:ATP-dependent RNA helicase RhlE
MPFQKLGLHASLVKNVLKLGYSSPTPIQSQAIPVVQSGRDLVATAQTGSGKTAAFLLPILHQLLERPLRSTGALILTPTRELASQIDEVFRGLAAGTPLRCALVVGGVPADPQTRSLRGGVEVVVATPGRLLDHLKKGTANLSNLHTLVLDEADQMFDMGFLPDLKRIVSRLPAQRQTLLFSATMPHEVARLSRSILRDPLSISVGEQGIAAPDVTQTAYPVSAQRKTALLGHLINSWERPSVLVFTRTKHGARRLATSLAASGLDVAELHSDRSPAQRTRAMHVFRARTVPVMVATNIASRGLDVRHITHVVNYDVPHTTEEYVHRIGRTGRAGDTGDSLLLVAPEEYALMARLERQLGHRIPRKQLPEFDHGSVAALPGHEPRPISKPHRRAGARRGAVAGRR